MRPLLALWPVANGPELLNPNGTPSGIAEAFANPPQHVREDFGTTRIDTNLTANDLLFGVYTADDSDAPQLCSLIRPGGCYVALRGLSDSAFLVEQAARGVRCVAASGPASVADFAQMARIVAKGLIKPIVSGVYQLVEFRDALERVREGHVRGKLVLRVAS